jgi:membrane peptidoglycan carboxypeptidase
MGRCKRGFAPIAWALTASLLVTGWPVALFYDHYWPRVQRLPAQVVAHETRHGGRWVTLREVSPWVPKALIATEDRSFYTNLGISWVGIVRSLLVDLRTHQFTEGGSTLTQQLVRNVFLSPVKKFRRKISEALLAVLVTALYSKREILTLYVNEVYFGQGAYGIQMASQRYFGQSARSLSLAQASLLAGLVQAPSYLDPFLHFSAAKRRQWVVLQSMVQDHQISQRQAVSAFDAPLALRAAGHTVADFGHIGSRAQ